jgi:hypothetical protein
MRYSHRRSALVAAVMLVLLAGVFAALRVSSHGAPSRIAAKPLAVEGQGADINPGGESNDYLRAAQEFADERTAPDGIVEPGKYSDAVAALGLVPGTGGSWTDVTARKYDAESIHYRDYYSNSGGGSGFVTGRITGLAADAAGDIYAAGADGGVWRRIAGTNHWEAIADQLPSLSSGDLELGPDGSLWYATGEANTGGTSYVGSGVYRLGTPNAGQFTPSTRVGGNELESTTIGKVRFSKDGRTAWAATLRGVWFMPLNAQGVPTAAHWTLAFAPNPGNLLASLQQYTIPGSALSTATFGTSTSSSSNAPYKNIVNDVAVDPKNAQHVIAAVAWRSGDTYNGFYETLDGGRSWTKVNPTGAIPANDIGYVTFAFSAQGDKLYAINQSPTLLNKLTGTVNSYLDGIYVSNNGSPAGPWSKIADSQKLANSGSALKQAVGGKGYGPGIQAWYNQFLAVDPADSNHVYAGLEEVYETQNGGSNWDTIGPYWNFLFSCWRLDSTYDSENNTYNTCPNTTHPDQHSVAIGGSGSNAFVVVGNDGGMFERPLHGHVNGNGNATDWRSLNDGSIDALQYYAVGVGRINPAVHTITSTAGDNGAVVDETKLDQVGAGSGVLVSGGLQDNGGSLVNPDNSGNMVSNFGGDGGDVLVDPNDGCNIVQEYVVLSMTITQTCGSPDPQSRPNAFIDLNQSTQFKIGPRDINARFIAPFVANKTNINEWMAGGNSLWIQENGFAIRSRDAWTKAAGSTLADAGKVYTALAMRGNRAVGAWCGTCNNNGFKRGVVLGTHTGTAADGWTFAQLPTTGLPNRYVGGVAIGADGTIYAGMNGFSRRFTEGPGAEPAISGHMFKFDETQSKWVSIDDNFPDVPVNSVQALNSGALLAGTDLGVLYRAVGATSWQRLGPTSGGTQLPLTVVMDVEVGPDNQVYAATHGRGIWRIPLP